MLIFNNIHISVKEKKKEKIHLCQGQYVCQRLSLSNRHKDV